MTTNTATPHMPGWHPPLAVLPEGMRVEVSPNFTQIRCDVCGCTVGASHRPGGVRCVEGAQEREISRSERWS